MVKFPSIFARFALTALIAFIAVMAVHAVTPGLAAERVALVIGNSAYKNTGVLKNPRNDAEGVSDALSKMGFRVIKGLDVDQYNFRNLVRTFTRELKDAKLALFFYAGHGLQVHDKNFLVPTDAVLKEESDLDFEALDLSFILQQMERGERTNIVLLDACRDNPLARNLSRNMGTRSAIIGRGLARVETGVGTFVGFATQPGNVALDGDFENSPFTAALLKHIEQPGLDIGVLMRRVREDVISMTDGKQVPWSNSSLVGEDVILNTDTRQIAVEPKANSSAGVSSGQAAEPKSGPDDKYSGAAANTAIELAFWNSVKDSKNPTLINAYLSQYPNGIFADLAKVMLAGLEADVPGQAKKEVAEEVAPKAEPQKLASVDGEYSANPVPETKPGVDYSLSADLQTELNRLGCTAGRADGIWGRKSRAALQQYAKYAGLSIDEFEPTGRLLEQMRAKQSRVCPLVCGARYNKSGGRCVLKTCERGYLLSTKGQCYKKKPVVRKQPTRKKKRRKAPQQREEWIEPDFGPPPSEKPWENELRTCPQCLTL